MKNVVACDAENCQSAYQREVFTKQMQDRLDEYEVENRLPDKELKDFYEKMKQDIDSGGVKVNYTKLLLFYRKKA